MNILCKKLACTKKISMPDLLNNKQKQKRPATTRACQNMCLSASSPSRHHQGYGFRFSNHWFNEAKPNMGSSILQARTRLELLEQHSGHDCTSKSLHKVNVCRQKKTQICKDNNWRWLRDSSFVVRYKLQQTLGEIFHIHSHHFELVHFLHLGVILLFDDLESRIFLLIQRKGTRYFSLL